MRFQKVKECDKLFKISCALHNMLIKSDGIDTNWMGYDQALMQDQQRRVQFPPMLLCLHSLYVEQIHTTSRSSDAYVASDWKRKLERLKDMFTVNGVRKARLMPQSLFIECLVEHFNIMYQRQQIVWPRRTQTINSI